MKTNSKEEVNHVVPEHLIGEILELTPAAMEFMNLDDGNVRVGMVVMSFDLRMAHTMCMRNDVRGEEILRQVPDNTALCLKAVDGVYGRFRIV